MKKLYSLLIIPIALVMTACTKKATTDNDFPGYKLVKAETVETIGSEVVELTHKKSGASVVLIKNSDPAKSFMVGFRTPPYDDTGLFHIFEHAVLEGSRLYPSKSNFFHLANSSVASFINAMTGPVYTLYPFVTRSDKDFDNLLSVYMDAVFFPNVLNDERIIRREGWRYEINPETKKMGINGIVLSEMKGAFSSPYRSVWFQLSRALIPDTPFAYSSGGLPEKVATLTFDQIKEAHKKYYHPQNSVVYLYGDLDFEKALATIDQQFLAEFNRTEDYQRPAIPLQKDFKYPTPVVESTYPGEAGPSKDFVARGFVLGESLTDLEESAASVLSQAFIEKNAAPLKLRMLSEGLAKSTFSTDFGGEDNGLAFVFEGAQAGDLKKIEQVLNEEIDKVIESGLDPELLTGILNKYEFSFKEKNSNGSHKGMQLGSIVLSNWIYQDQPLAEALDFVAHFKKLRALLSDQQFVKDFFKKHLRDNKKTRWVTLSPDPDFSKKFNAGLDKQVESALKSKPLAEFKKQDDVYQKWVAEKESPDILAKTPTLDLKDIKADEKAIAFSEEKLGSTDVLLYPQDTSGISYINLYFDLKGVSEDNLKNLDFLTSFIQKTDSKNLSFKELEKQLDTYIGSLGFGLSSYQSTKNPEQFKPTLIVSLRFIDANREKAMELVSELLQNAQFGPSSRLSDLVAEMQTNMMSGVSYRAPSLSMGAATKSFYPQQGAFSDAIGGGVFEHYMISTKFKGESLAKTLRTMRSQVFDKNRLYLASITAPKKQLPVLKSDVQSLKEQLPEGAKADQTWAFTDQTDYDGYAIPGEVQYVSQATSYKDKGLEYDGSMLVYARYLNNHYMTPQLREQAGAYGGGAAFSKNGLFRMSTYRDPNLSKSFDIFSKAISFMEKEKWTPEKLKPAMLGSLKPYYKDESIYGKTSLMTDLYLTDQSWQDYLVIKKQIMETTADDFKKITAVLKKAVPESTKAVAGNEEKINKEAGFLKKVLSIR